MKREEKGAEKERRVEKIEEMKSIVEKSSVEKRR